MGAEAMPPLLTRDFLATMIRDLTLDLTPEGRLKTALATGLMAAWDDLDAMDKAYHETVAHCEQWIARAEAAEADITTYQEIVSTMTQEAESAEAKLAERDAENARMREALEPSGDTKAAYIGEVKDPETKRTVSWTAIKMVMKMISARALLNKEPKP